MEKDIKPKDSKWYDEVFRNGKEWNKFSHQWNRIYQTTWQWIHENGWNNILDVGCGMGLLMDRCSIPLHHVHYLGIDFSKVAIEKMEEKGYRCERMDINFMGDLIYWPNFQVIVILEVLEHIEKDIKVLESIPVGKKLIISLPKEDDESHLRYFEKWEEVTERYGGLIRIIKSKELERWFVIEGVRI